MRYFETMARMTTDRALIDLRDARDDLSIEIGILEDADAIDPAEMGTLKCKLGILDFRIAKSQEADRRLNAHSTSRPPICPGGIDGGIVTAESWHEERDRLVQLLREIESGNITHVDEDDLRQLQATNPENVAFLKDRLAKLNARLGDGKV